MNALDKALAPQDNVFRYLSHWAGVFPEKTAIAFPRTVREDGGIDYDRITFGELEARASRLAAVLRARGIKRGDRVVVMIPMSVELYTLLLALLKMAAVIVLIDPWVGLEQIKRCIALTEPVAFAGVPLIQLLGRVSGVLRPIPHRITARGPARFGEWSFDKLLQEEAPSVETEQVEPDTPALITFTTGSTGMPKGANRTHGFLVAQHLALSRELALTPADVDLPALPVFVLNNLASGVTSVVPKMKASKPSDVDPTVILRQIQDFGVTTAVGSPAYWAPIADHCLAKGLTLPSLRGVFTGGGPVPPGLLGKLRRVLPNGKAYIGYGSTEAEPVALIGADEVCDETGPRTDAGEGNCVGRLAHGIEARIIRVTEGPVELGPDGWNDVELPAGSIGELVVTGDHVGKDYYRNPQAVRENKIRDPQGRMWHRLGDVGYLDEQERVWLVGRVNNIVRRSDRSFYPIQIEALVQHLPFVERAALLGLPDATLGQRLALVVMPHRTNPLQWRRKIPEWQLRVQDYMRRQDIPLDELLFVKEMPVDPRHNVKIDYGKLAQRFTNKK